jgi:hypothetical protein
MSSVLRLVALTFTISARPLSAAVVPFVVPPIRREAIPYSNPLIGASRHVVHFYESDDELASSVATFFLAGLLGGCGCVAIATHDHGLRIASKLRECGVDVEHAMRSHQLAIFDAEPMLGEICSSGKPDQAAFNRIATQAAQKTHLHFSHILFFGEMVGISVLSEFPAPTDGANPGCISFEPKDWKITAMRVIAR